MREKIIQALAILQTLPILGSGAQEVLVIQTLLKEALKEGKDREAVQSNGHVVEASPSN